jgi:hypothetical protein
MTKKNTSSKKKLLPAAGMLALSAAMLSSATFAWFTMSREVEVKGIKMTATVPEDLQISLGTIGTNATTAATENTKSLAASDGVLVEKASGTTASDGNVMAPTNAWDWSNSADISAYYDFGRLIPASSNDGAEIFFTPDADGVGKTVKGSASYYQATDKLTAEADAGSGTTYKTTLHALTAERSAGTDTWAAGGEGKYKQASAWDTTNDDGYYVDIPVWIRTSSNTAVNLSVDGYVIPGSVKDATNGDTQSQLELYRAVRVALLDGETVTADADTGAVACSAGDVAAAAGANIIPLKDAWSTDGTTLVGATSALTDTNKYKTADLKALNAPYDSTKSILDSLNYKRATVGDTTMADTDLYGVSAVATTPSQATDGTQYYAATYSKYDALKPTGDATPANVATIAGSTTGGEYGAAKKLIVRVWLDGEDQECWNDNAGQDWNITLKFSKI